MQPTLLPHSNGYDTVSLREFLEQRLSAMDKAICIQSAELARRLDNLNHDHVRSKEDRQQYLTREVFDQSQRAVTAWREQVSATLAEAKGRASTLAAIYAVASSLVVGLIVLIVSRMWK